MAERKPAGSLLTEHWSPDEACRFCIGLVDISAVLGPTHVPRPVHVAACNAAKKAGCSFSEFVVRALESHCIACGTWTFADAAAKIESYRGAHVAAMKKSAADEATRDEFSRHQRIEVPLRRAIDNVVTGVTRGHLPAAVAGLKALPRLADRAGVELSDARKRIESRLRTPEARERLASYWAQAERWWRVPTKRETPVAAAV